MWIQTFTGKAFNPIDPDIGLIDVRDIAHSLSLICRFNGHTKFHYSVGQHSLYVSRMCSNDPKEQLWGLLHDAAEAYLCDLIRPIKVSITGYKEHEDKLLRVIMEKFKLPPAMPASVKEADERMLHTEASIILNPCVTPWSDASRAYPNADQFMVELEPKRVEWSFLERFAQLTEIIN